MRWALPILVASTLCGCGGCVDDPSAGSAPPAASAPSPLNPAIQRFRPRPFTFGRIHSLDGGTAPPVGDDT